jgi:hypothetical protein
MPSPRATTSRGGHPRRTSKVRALREGRARALDPQRFGGIYDVGREGRGKRRHISARPGPASRTSCRSSSARCRASCTLPRTIERRLASDERDVGTTFGEAADRAAAPRRHGNLLTSEGGDAATRHAIVTSNDTEVSPSPTAFLRLCLSLSRNSLAASRDIKKMACRCACLRASNRGRVTPLRVGAEHLQSGEIVQYADYD